MALSHQKVPWIPKAVVKEFGAGVLTFSLWNVHPSICVMLEDAMILNKAADQSIKDDSPTKVESQYPQPIPQEKKRLKEIDAEEEKKRNDFVRNKHLDKALDGLKTEINQYIDTKIDDVKTELNTKFNGLMLLFAINTGAVVAGQVLPISVMFYFEKEENQIKKDEFDLEKKAAKAWRPWK